jgi:uncharacterized protein YybS (DUF2232 family)
MLNARLLSVAVAVSSGLYAAGVALAPSSAPLLALVPLPGLVLSTRGTGILCVLWCALTVGVVTALLGAGAAPGFLLLSAFPALVIGTGIRRLWSLEATILGGLFTWCLGMAVLALSAYHDLSTLNAAVRPQLEASVNLALSTYGSIGASEATLAVMQAERDALVNGLLEILPAVTVLMGALTFILNLLLLRSWTDATRGVNLRLWRTPDVLIWVLIVTGFGMFAPLPELAVVAKNLLLLVLACYFCQGLAIVSYYLDRFRLPRGIRVVGYVFIAVQHVVAALVLALGVFDLWGNFRRLSAGPADIQLHPDGE